MKNIELHTAMTKLKRRDRCQLNPHRADYLHIFRNLQTAHHKDVMMRSVDFLWDLMTTHEKMILLRILRASSKMRQALNTIDAGEHLPALLKDEAETSEGRSILVAQRMLRIMHSDESCQGMSGNNPFILELATVCSFNEIECHFLFGLCLLEMSPVSVSLIFKAQSEAQFIQLAATALSLPSPKVFEICQTGEKLMSAGIIFKGTNCVCLGDGVLDGFRGDISISDYKSLIFKIDSLPVYSIESFDFSHKAKQIAEALLRTKSSCNLLFYGKPGVGKTELTRALIRAVDREIVVISPYAGDRRENRLSRVHLATLFAEKAVIVVDEAEDILNTETNRLFPGERNQLTKSMLNTFLDQTQAKIIWIVNDYTGIHESTFRRFDFKIQFESLTLRQRAQAIDLILEKHGQQKLREQPFIANLIRDDSLTPGILDRCIQSYVNTLPFLTELTADAIVPELIASHKNRKKRQTGLTDRVENYSSDILNIEGQIEPLLNAAKHFHGAQITRGGGLNVLLHGLPGTGKTEFVKHVARTCGAELIIKRGSDLLSMFVGGTEERIAAAFREAERNKAILLIDEADTFFQARENAVHSWEISQTNEFLNQMENHTILLFCCTNFASHFDHASKRRFHFKLEFKPMRTDRRTDFFMRFFDHLLLEKPQGEILAAELLGLPDLTPGDFQAVRKRYSFHEQNSISWRELVSELQKETKYKTNTTGRRIGF